jgi:hypothetical protein
MSRMIATAEASRTPVAINGAALGSDTMRTVASPENPNARFASTEEVSGSRARSPVTVVSFISGQ